MDGVQEKKRPHALVEIVAVAPETVECLAFKQQILQCRRAAECVQRAIASFHIASGYDLSKQAHCSLPAGGAVSSRSASISTKCVRTSSRSRLFNARASCAVSNP